MGAEVVQVLSHLGMAAAEEAVEELAQRVLRQRILVVLDKELLVRVVILISKARLTVTL
jgi:hypothetical protein